MLLKVLFHLVLPAHWPELTRLESEQHGPSYDERLVEGWSHFTSWYKSQ